MTDDHDDRSAGDDPRAQDGVPGEDPVARQVARYAAAVGDRIPATPTTVGSASGRRAAPVAVLSRRRVAAAIGVAAALVAALGVWAASDDPDPLDLDVAGDESGESDGPDGSTDTTAPGDTITVAITGMLGTDPLGHTELCPHGQPCAGVEVVGDVPSTDGRHRFTGRLDTDLRFTITGVEDAPVPAGLVGVDFATPCTDQPDGGGQSSPSANVASAWSEANGDRVASVWFDQASGLLNLRLVGEDPAAVEAARTELAAAGADLADLCVVGGGTISRNELVDLSTRVFDVLGRHSDLLGNYGGAADEMTGTVQARLFAVDATIRAELAAELGDRSDLVHLDVVVEVLDATLADLPRPTPGPVAILTQRAPSSISMLALGRFTLRHDAEAGCFYAESEGGGQRIALSWPYGYRGEVDPLRVVDFDGTTVAEVGEAFEVGGGYAGPAGAGSGADDPGRCGATEEAFIVGG